MDNQEPQNKKSKEKKSASKGSKVNALVILICIDMIGFMASLYSLKAFSDANIFLIPAALTLVMSVITAMIYVQMRHQDEDDRQRVAGDVAEALSAIIEITKNDQKLMDQKIDDLSEEYQIPAQEIINAVKALAKVSLGRSKENATALINSNEAVVTQVMDLQDKIDALEQTVNKSSDADLSKVIDENSHKVSVGLDDLSHDVQRLDQDMRRLEKITKDIEIHPTIIQGVQAQAQAVTEKSTEPQNQDDLVEEPVSEPLDDLLNDETTIPAEEYDDDTETMTDDDLSSMLEPDENSDTDSDDIDTGDDGLDLTIDDDSQDDSDEQEIGLDDLNLDEEPATDDNEEQETDEQSVSEEPVPEEDVPEDNAATVNEENESSDTPAAAASAIDTSDPNKQLSPDEIASLFAQADNMVQDEKPESEETPSDDQPESDELASDDQPVAEEPVIDEEPVTEDKAPVETPSVDTSDTPDPNKRLTPDEIAALFAQAGNNSESTPDDTDSESTQASSDTSEPEASGDPNRMMTPEEIEALFSNVS